MVEFDLTPPFPGGQVFRVNKDGFLELVDLSSTDFTAKGQGAPAGSGYGIGIQPNVIDGTGRNYGSGWGRGYVKLGLGYGLGEGYVNGKGR